jgi:hypothetical protein
MKQRDLEREGLEKTVKETKRLRPTEVLEKVEALKLCTPSEAASMLREDRDAR